MLSAKQLVQRNQTVPLISIFFLLFTEGLNTFNRINRNEFKPPVSEAVKQIVRANFTREIEFYEFCKQRLHMQLKALRDPTVTLPMSRRVKRRALKQSRRGLR